MDTLFGQIVHTLKNPESGAHLLSLGQDDWKAYARKIGTRMRDEILTAKRYHLSSDFTQNATVLAFNVEDPFRDLVNKARIPFDSIWLEWPNEARLGGLGLLRNGEATPLEIPEFSGVLINRINNSSSHFIITSVLNISDYSSYKDYIDWCPVSIEVNLSKPIDADYRKKQMQYFRESLLTFIRGKAGNEAANYDEDEVTYLFLQVTMMGGKSEHLNFDCSPELIKISEHAVFLLTPYYGDIYNRIINNEKEDVETRKNLKNGFTEVIGGMSGLYRFVLSALALLNDKDYIKIEPIKPGKSRPGSLVKPKLQASYDFVTMTAPYDVFIREKQGKSEAKHDRIRHEVSGTWVNYHNTGKEDCQHAFANMDDTANRKICLLCGRRKSWRREHERGNIELGFKPRQARLVLDE